MAERKKTTKTTTTNEHKNDRKMETLAYTIDRVFETSDGVIIFDATVNEVKLYGLSVRNGQYGPYVSYPSRKAKDGNYYGYMFLPMSDEQLDAFIQAVYDKADAK